MNVDLVVQRQLFGDCDVLLELALLALLEHLAIDEGVYRALPYPLQLLPPAALGLAEVDPLVFVVQGRAFPPHHDELPVPESAFWAESDVKGGIQEGDGVLDGFGGRQFWHFCNGFPI